RGGLFVLYSFFFSSRRRHTRSKRDWSSDVCSSDLNDLLKQLRSKFSRNFMRASLYDGKHALERVSPIMPPEYYQLGIVLGWSGKAVDALARRCNLDGFVWADGDLDGLGLQEFADGNLLFPSLKSAFVSSLIHGLAFLISTKIG